MWSSATKTVSCLVSWRLRPMLRVSVRALELGMNSLMIRHKPVPQSDPHSLFLPLCGSERVFGISYFVKRCTGRWVLSWSVGMLACVCKKTRALVGMWLLCFSSPQGIIGVSESHPPFVLIFSKAFLT